MAIAHFFCYNIFQYLLFQCIPMDQLFKEYILMCLIIGFNLEHLFGLAFFSSHRFRCDVLFWDLFAFVIVYFKLRHILNRPAQGSNLLTDALEVKGLPPYNKFIDQCPRGQFGLYPGSTLAITIVFYFLFHNPFPCF